MNNDSTVPETATIPKIHKDAFLLMEYQDPITKESVFIWNSRDGVTPFAINCRGREGRMHHVNWENDKFLPDHTPKIGDCIFVNFNIEHALPISRKFVDDHWDKGLYQMQHHSIFGLMSKEEAVGCHAQASIESGDRPYLFVVTEEWLKEQADQKATIIELNRKHQQRNYPH